MESVSRTIKFRAWDTEQKKYLVSPEIAEWVDIKLRHNHRGFEVASIYKDHIVIEQSTGLKDSKGREIYEGDIVKSESGSYGEVIYDESKMAFQFDSTRGFYHPVEGFRHPLEVIGNIHENPELLEVST